MRDWRLKCRHFGAPVPGVQEKVCDAGIVFDKQNRSFKDRCWNQGETSCPKYRQFSVQEIAEKKKEIEHYTRCMAMKISPCCEAPIDNSCVIKSGRYKGHGGRYCSKCGKCVYFV